MRITVFAVHMSHPPDGHAPTRNTPHSPPPAASSRSALPPLRARLHGSFGVRRLPCSTDVALRSFARFLCRLAPAAHRTPRNTAAAASATSFVLPCAARGAPQAKDAGSVLVLRRGPCACRRNLPRGPQLRVIGQVLWFFSFVFALIQYIHFSSTLTLRSL